MKQFFLLGLVSFFLLASCSDDDSSKKNSELILGEWKFYGITNSFGGYTYAATPCGYWQTVTYTEDTQLDQYLDGNCKPTGPQILNPYRIVGNELIIKDSDGNDIKFQIDVLNSEELILSIPGQSTLYKR